MNTSASIIAGDGQPPSLDISKLTVKEADKTNNNMRDSKESVIKAFEISNQF